MQAGSNLSVTSHHFLVKSFTTGNTFSPLSLLLSSVLVVAVVREVVHVVFYGHEQAGKPAAAAQLGGKDHARDQVVGGRVG